MNENNKMDNGEKEFNQEMMAFNRVKIRGWEIEKKMKRLNWITLLIALSALMLSGLIGLAIACR